MNVKAFPHNNTTPIVHTLSELIPPHLWNHGGVIEVISEQHHINQLQLLLPTLAQLTQGGRWLAWVASPFRCTSQSLQQLNTDPYRLLQIHPGKQSHHLNVVGRALSTGRCGVVMAWSKHHNDQELQQLKQAARRGNAIGVLFSQTPSHKNTSCSADLQVHLQHHTDELMITLSAPHFTGQRHFRYLSNKPIDSGIIVAPTTEEITTQLSFF